MRRPDWKAVRQSNRPSGRARSYAEKERKIETPLRYHPAPGRIVHLVVVDLKHAASDLFEPSNHPQQVGFVADALIFRPAFR